MSWGNGRVFQRGHIWWIAYYKNGREYRESTYSESQENALSLLESRMSIRIEHFDNNVVGYDVRGKGPDGIRFRERRQIPNLNETEVRSYALDRFRYLTTNGQRVVDRKRQFSPAAFVKGLKTTGTFVYLITGGDFCKIGYTKNIQTRVKELQTSCPFPLKVIATVPGDLKLESKLHSKFAHLRQTGEWFKLSPEILKEFDVT